METITIQVNDKKAYKLIRDLEDLNIIKVIKNIKTEKKLSEKYAGKLPSDIAEDLQNYVSQSRKQWNNI